MNNVFKKGIICLDYTATMYAHARTTEMCETMDVPNTKV
jgi:hypothetical protein